MIDDSEKIRMGKIMTSGVIICVCIILSGALFYLFSHGGQTASYTTFRQPLTMFSTIGGMLKNIFSNPLALIQCGLLVLIFTQIVRVALTTWFFLRIKDRPFVVVSIIILVILIYSLL